MKISVYAFGKGPKAYIRKGRKTMKTKTRYAKHLHFLEIALLIALAVFLASGAAALGSRDAIADKVVRLHVLANSDSETDQALKLKVRDRVLERAAELLEESENRDQAEKCLTEALPELEALAAEEIAANGYDYPVTARLEEVSFPTKEYDGFTLPAGKYLALRVIIGEGAGKNWWCVVFPPLCTAVSSDVPQTAMAAGLTEAEVGLITGEDQGYVLKFKAVEWWEALRERLEEP